MPLFYTLDRLNMLNSGITINLIKYQDIVPAELQIHADKMFPNGVSSFGERYFLKNSSDPRLTEPAIELVFEYVRRANFPKNPSRFQSVFGFESLSQALEFRDKFGGGQGTIWEAESKRYFKADMSLLTLGSSILMCSYFANKYWSGKPGSNPFWEILLIPPVKVLRELYPEKASTTGQ